MIEPVTTLVRGRPEVFCEDGFLIINMGGVQVALTRHAAFSLQHSVKKAMVTLFEEPTSATVLPFQATK